MAWGLGRGVVKQESGRVSRGKMALLEFGRWFSIEGNLASETSGNVWETILKVRTERGRMVLLGRR